jgi:hypothetical protein
MCSLTVVTPCVGCTSEVGCNRLLETKEQRSVKQSLLVLIPPSILVRTH